MSWLLPTTLMIMGGFAAAFGLCEWFIARRGQRRNGDDDRAHG